MWPNPQSPADLVTFTEKIFNGKLHIFCSVDFLKFDEVELIICYLNIIVIILLSRLSLIENDITILIKGIRTCLVCN